MVAGKLLVLALVFLLITSMYAQVIALGGIGTSSAIDVKLLVKKYAKYFQIYSI